MAEIKEGHELNARKEGGIAEQMTPKSRPMGADQNPITGFA
jgi:hypothetical protein